MPAPPPLSTPIDTHHMCSCHHKRKVYNIIASSSILLLSIINLRLLIVALTVDDQKLREKQPPLSLHSHNDPDRPLSQPQPVHRVAYVTFSYVKDRDPRQLASRILPALDTWAAPLPGDDVHDPHRKDPSLFVVYSNASKEPFEKYCVSEKCKRIQPIYVDCPEGKYGESSCCKQQMGLASLYSLYNSESHPAYDWYAFFDDDTYLRKEYLTKILSKIATDTSIPLAAIPSNQVAKSIGYEKITCSSKDYYADQFQYPWGMPIFYSRGALQMMERGYRADSLVLQCNAFGATHDAGNAILNWMYGLPVRKIPPLPGLEMGFGNEFIGSHNVGRFDPRSDRDVSFKATHEFWMDNKYNPPDIDTLPMFVQKDGWYHNVTGFRETKTYARYGDPQQWDEGVWNIMSVENCTI